MDSDANLQTEQNKLEIINNLAVSDKLKEKLRLVHENLRGTKLGFPDIRPKDDTPANRMALTWKVFNCFAFFFNILYYLVKGMWRKALVLFVINIVIMLTVALVTEDPGLTQISSLVICAVCAQCAYYDLYRKLVKNEVFWW